MVEKGPQESRFRAHHAPRRSFEILNATDKAPRKLIINNFMRSQDWGNSHLRPTIEATLISGHKKE